MFQIASFKVFCTDSTKILFSQILLKSFFSKLGSAGLNYHLPKLSFFTDPYCAGGGGGESNKHCLLTFSINNFTLFPSVFCRIRYTVTNFVVIQSDVMLQKQVH